MTILKKTDKCVTHFIKILEEKSINISELPQGKIAAYIRMVIMAQDSVQPVSDSFRRAMHTYRNEIMAASNQHKSIIGLLLELRTSCPEYLL